MNITALRSSESFYLQSLNVREVLGIPKLAGGIRKKDGLGIPKQ